LKALPRTLDETYDRILGSIEEQYREAAHTALQWLAFSVRPLRLEEIVEVVAVVLGGSTGFLDERPSNPQDVLGICSSLVTISSNSNDELSDTSNDESSHTPNDELPDTSNDGLSDASNDGLSDASNDDLSDTSNKQTSQIYLAHYSVKEYLTSDRILAGSASAFACFETSANRNITELCLTYLSSFERPDTLTYGSLTAFPLLSYASRFWFKHAQTANEEMGLDPVIVKFLNEAKSLILLNRLLDLHPSYEGEVTFFRITPSKVGSPLYYASYYGLSRVAAMLAEGGADVNAQGGEYGNALQAAAYNSEDVSLIKLLLKAGADVNAQGGCYENALQAAIWNRENVTVMKLLLEAGADVNVQCGEYGNALQPAVLLNDVSLIKLLLKAGADVNAQGGRYGNALQAAIWNRENVTLMKLLLKAGADVNIQCEEYDNALQPAVLLNDVSLIKLLLKEGADVNAQGGHYGNALQAAAYKCKNVSLIKLLLEAGADVNAQGGRYGNALQAAAYKCKDVSLIKLLLEAGADVNAQGGKYGNALQASAHLESEEIFELLLEHGAVVTQEGDFDRPWDAARFGADMALQRWNELGRWFEVIDKC